MSYTKCILCLQKLEVIKPASGVPYLLCVKWKECPFFCPEETVHRYQQCIYERIIPDYKVCEGGKQLFCKHEEVPTLRVSRSERNPYRPYFSFRRKKNVSTFNGQMNFLLLMKKKHLPTDQDPSYKDNNLVEQMAVDIRLYT